MCVGPAEFLVASRCQGPGFCPSCQARRVVEWSLWLGEHLLAAVPHPQVVLMIPKRLRGYFLYDRRRLERLSRVANETLRRCVRAPLGESDVVPGVLSLARSFGSLAHLHPHLQVIVTNGAFRRDGSFMPITGHDPAVLTEAWRCAPVAESRLRYDAERAEVELKSHASEGPYAGVHRFTALEFLARRVDHIPAKGEARVRYSGAYARRR